MAHWLDISRTRSSMIHELHRYWNAKRGARRMPTRGDIDPGEIKHLLPYVLIVDLEGEAPRVRFRLLGTKIVAASGRDFTGRYLDEFVPNDVDKLWQTYYRIARDERVPVLGDAAVPADDGGRYTYEFAIFPLGPDGEHVTQCLSIEDYGRMNDRLADLASKTRPWWPRDEAPPEKAG